MRSIKLKYTDNTGGGTSQKKANPRSTSHASQVKANYMQRSANSSDHNGKVMKKSTTQVMKKSRPHKCLICRKSFTRSQDLKRHSSIHNKKGKTSGKTKADSHGHASKKLHKCPFCHKSFSQRIGVEVHLRVHTRERPYNCSVCSKSFSQFGNLKVHERIHTGFKQHGCTLCIRSFYRVADLQRHEKTHRSRIPHQCSVCAKPFTELSKLKEHLNTHKLEVEKSLVSQQRSASVAFNKSELRKPTQKREKLYKCLICPESFGQSIQLTVHLTEHEVGNPYQCPNCPKKFAGSRILQRHLDLHTLMANFPRGIPQPEILIL